MRVSSYNIYVPLSNDEKEYMFMNGAAGTMDVVSEDVYIEMMNVVEQGKDIESIDKNILENLLARGYITEKNEEEEKAFFKKVVNIIQDVSKKYIHFTVMPTYNCNFRCSYCFERNLLKNGNEWLNTVITEEVIDRIFSLVDKMESEGKKINKTFTLYGGEPLLKENHDIVRYFIERSKGRGIHIKAVSNGYDLNCYEDLLGKDGIECIQITLDGIEEYHNQKRFLKGNKPTFHKIIENIDLALEKGVRIDLRTNIDVNNVNQISELSTFYKEKGWVEKDNFSYYFKNVHGCYIPEENYVKEDEIFSEINQVDSKKNYLHSNVGLTLAKNIAYIINSGKVIVPRASFCGATTSMYVIDPFGDIYPCWEVVGQKEDCCLGNIMDENFENNETYQYWRNRDINHIQECSECKYAIFCGGGCPAHIRARKGNIYLPYCAEFKEIFNDVVAQVYAENKK